MMPILHSLSIAIAFTTCTGSALSSSSSSSAESNRNKIENERQLIYGGWQTEEDRYSYAQVSLQQTEGDDVEKLGHQCGGSLVAPDMVLTAGHCKGLFNEIEIGKYTPGNASDASERFAALYERRHPLFVDNDHYRYDVMLIRLSGTSTMGRPVRINADPSVPSDDTMLTVIGMGQQRDGELPSSVQETSVQFSTNSECSEVADEHGLTLGSLLESEMMCAGSSGRDACFGDSGSPLILKGEHEQNDTQVGIVSWGYDCAGALPGVYSRLSHPSIYTFIERIVCRHSALPPSYMDCDKWIIIPTSPPAEMTVPSTTEETGESMEFVSLLPDLVGVLFRNTDVDTSGDTTDGDNANNTTDDDNANNTTRSLMPETSSAFSAVPSSYAKVIILLLFSATWACLL